MMLACYWTQHLHTVSAADAEVSHSIHTVLCMDINQLKLLQISMLNREEDMDLLYNMIKWHQNG